MRALGALPLAALAAGCAAPATPPARCFFHSEVSGFSDAGPDRAIVRIGARRAWELTLSPGCPDVDWALGIGIRPRGGNRICEGRPAELIVPYPGSGSRACPVRSIRRLDGAEAAAALGRR